jgi:hypothetical protein
MSDVATTEHQKPKHGRPRIEDRDRTAEARKPWVAAGMSRSTWYRRKKERAGNG